MIPIPYVASRLASERLKLHLETNTGLRDFIIGVTPREIHVHIKDINYAHHVPATFEGFVVKTCEINEQLSALFLVS